MSTYVVPRRALTGRSRGDHRRRDLQLRVRRGHADLDLTLDVGQGGRLPRSDARSANPAHWALSDMRTMMRIHLNQVIALAVDQLDGHYAAAIRLYGVYIHHIISMADMLSTGIIQQFPSRF